MIGMSQTAAETMAIQAVTFLSQEEALLETFLGGSGLTPEDLRARLEDPALLASVLAFLLADDARLLAFCAQNALRAEDIHRAQYALEQIGSRPGH